MKASRLGAAARPFHLSTMGKTGALPDIAGTSGWPLHIEKLTTRRLFGRQRPMYTAPETLPLQQGGGNAASDGARADSSPLPAGGTACAPHRALGIEETANEHVPFPPPPKAQ